MDRQHGNAPGRATPRRQGHDTATGIVAHYLGVRRAVRAYLGQLEQAIGAPFDSWASREIDRVHIALEQTATATGGTW